MWRAPGLGSNQSATCFFTIHGPVRCKLSRKAVTSAVRHGCMSTHTLQDSIGSKSKPLGPCPFLRQFFPCVGLRGISVTTDLDRVGATASIPCDIPPLHNTTVVSCWATRPCQDCTWLGSLAGKGALDFAGSIAALVKNNVDVCRKWWICLLVHAC